MYVPCVRSVQAFEATFCSTIGSAVLQSPLQPWIQQPTVGNTLRQDDGRPGGVSSRTHPTSYTYVGLRTAIPLQTSDAQNTLSKMLSNTVYYKMFIRHSGTIHQNTSW